MNSSYFLYSALIVIFFLSLLNLDGRIYFSTIFLQEVQQGSINIKVPDETVLTSTQFVNSPKQELSSVIFVGDILLARNIEYLMGLYGSDYPHRGIDFSDITNRSYVVGNFESAIPETHIPTEAFKVKFSVDMNHLDALRRAGFTHLSLANNHTLDFGERSFINTQKQLTNTDFEVFGHPLKLERQSVSFLDMNNSISVALIAFHTLWQQPTKDEVADLLHFASQHSDLQLAYVHWGDEYITVSNEYQKLFAKLLVESGVDMIIGHHPHVVQEIDVINGVPVFYSLGNYIFDQYFSNETQDGLLLKIGFADTITAELIPITSQYALSQPTYMKQEQRLKFLKDLALRSKPSLTPYIESGVIPINTLVATSSKTAMMNR